MANFPRHNPLLIVMYRHIVPFTLATDNPTGGNSLIIHLLPSCYY